MKCHWCHSKINALRLHQLKTGEKVTVCRSLKACDEQDAKNEQARLASLRPE